MKKIEITPEWILNELTVIQHVDGKGNITIVVDNMSNSPWIDLALDAISIDYKWDMFDNNPAEGERPFFEVHYEFRMKQLKKIAQISIMNGKEWT
jgi:hypothetical protein